MSPPDYLILNRCSNCGEQFSENAPSACCSYHPEPPRGIGNAGLGRDYAELWEFPCCGQKYVGTFTSSDSGIVGAEPPRSPGCRTGLHVPRFSFEGRR